MRSRPKSMFRLSVLAASALLLAACSTSSPEEAPPAGQANTTWGKLLRGTSEPAQEMDTTQIRHVAYCPKIEVRDGTQVYHVGAGGGPVSDPTAVRFQATITRFARECVQDGDTIRIRVGVAGRVLTGAQGGSATLSLPVRVVIVAANELGGEERVLYTRLTRVSAAVNAANPSVPWEVIDEEVTMPAEPGAIIYVGFDPKGDSAPARKKKSGK